MRAAVCGRYGPPEVVEVKEVPTPVPKDDEVLVRVRATTVSSGDARIRGANLPPGFRIAGRLALGVTRPRTRILGNDFAGDVEAVGRRVTRFSVGDAVFGAGARTHAQYVRVRADGPVCAKPSKLQYDEAAALVFGGVTALYFLRDLARVQRGEAVLVLGASGAVGTAAVQVARALGATVTGVSSRANLALVRSLGAHSVMGYETEDFTQRDERYDVVMDTVGKTTFAQCGPVLRPGGVYLPLVATLGQLIGGSRRRRGSKKRTMTGVATSKREYIETLSAMWSAGALAAVIDRRYPLDHAADAHRHVDQGHKKGNVILAP